MQKKIVDYCAAKCEWTARYGDAVKPFHLRHNNCTTTKKMNLFIVDKKFIQIIKIVPVPKSKKNE